MATPLDSEKYMSLETFRKDGTGVKTPVWMANLDDNLVVFTAGGSFKVKRLRRNPKCRVAACDMRGNVHGLFYEGTCVIVEDEAQIDRMHAALRKKYGLLMAVGDFFAGISGRTAKRKYLEVTLTG